MRKKELVSELSRVSEDLIHASWERDEALAEVERLLQEQPLTIDRLPVQALLAEAATRTKGVTRSLIQKARNELGD